MKRLAFLVTTILILANQNHAQSRPTLLLPINGQEVSTVNPELVWKYNVRPGIKFEVKIAEDAFFNSNVIVYETESTNLSCIYPYLRRGKVYYWTVRTIRLNQSTGKIDVSDWTHTRMKNPTQYMFSVSANARGFDHFSPRQLGPVDGVELDNLQPVLKWELNNYSGLTFKILSATQGFVNPHLTDIEFRIMLADDSEFKQNARSFYLKDGRDTFQLSLPILKPDSEYHWRVKAFYYDPVKEKRVESEWSSGTVNLLEGNFRTSGTAGGRYTFNEGMPEEEVGDLPIRFSLEALVTGEANNFAPAVSLDGRSLAFVSDRLGYREIFVKSLETRRTGGETQKTITQRNRYVFNPFYLHDDTELGFFANLYSDENWNMFSTNRGSSVTVLNRGMIMKESVNDFNLYGSCSTDGRIVFSTRSSENSEYVLYLLDLNDDSHTQLRMGLFPDIRDDDKIVFSSNETGNYEIWSISLEGRSVFRPTLLNTDPADDYDPVFSPGGGRIAFTSNRSGNSDIWVMNSDGSGLRQVTFHPMVDRRPQWIDHQTLVFQSNRTKNSKGEHVYSIFMVELRDQ